ncbi:hypothetical protein AUK57_02270 [Candidatus Saccharibacteria bacterium CG2_30_41_52]|nr:hypothetical protein [Candidatus Saccharibacteria bacterium]OIP85872.1 MAG: hypothetical protein AUK57_02270 [Candidatus Saccharibacteria bacterium CG2_30_41_52]
MDKIVTVEDVNNVHLVYVAIQQLDVTYQGLPVALQLESVILLKLVPVHQTLVQPIAMLQMGQFVQRKVADVKLMIPVMDQEHVRRIMQLLVLPVVHQLAPVIWLKLVLGQ